MLSMNYIAKNALVLIPVLYILGAFLKGLEYIKDKYIPLILLALGIGFSIIDAVIQGVLVTNL